MLVRQDDRCQRWNAGQVSWRHRSEGGFDRARFRVEQIDTTTAKTFVTGHHYSRSMPASRLAFGMFERGELVGAAVLGVPMGKKVLTNPFPTLTPFYQSAELSRFVLLDRVPANGETWFLARALRQARRLGLLGVLAFSDPAWGHWGTIYQARSAVPAGKSTARTRLILHDGLVLSDRAQSKVRAGETGRAYVISRLIANGARPPRAAEDLRSWLPEALAPAVARRERHGGCFRYLFPLAHFVARDLRTRPALAYPKRDRQRTA